MIDFDESLKSEETQKIILESLKIAFQREGHILSKHPELLWQQIYNRTQWIEEKLPSLFKDEKSAHFNKKFRPWLHLISPIHESHSLIRTMEGHSRPINCAALSPDNKILVSGGQDNELKIWDLESSQLVHSLSGHRDSVTTCDISGDGVWLLSGARDSMVKLWNISSASEALSLRGHEAFISQVKLGDDGSWGLSTGMDNSLIVWSFPSGELLNRIMLPKGSPILIIPSNHHKKFVFISNNNEVCIWVDGQIGVLGSHSDNITSICIYPNNRQLLSASKDKTIKLWGLLDYSVCTLVAHEFPISACSVSPDEKWIASGDELGNVIIWDNQSRNPMKKLKAHSNEVGHLQFSPNGELLLSASKTGIYSGGSDFNIKLWSIPTGDLFTVLKGHSEAVSFCAFSKDGSLIISSSLDKTIKIWQTPQQVAVEEVETHQGAISGCKINSNSNRIISCGQDKSVKSWSIPHLNLLRKLENLQKPPFACGYRKNEKEEIILFSTTAGLTQWTPVSGKIIGFSSQKTFGSNINFASFDENSKYYIVAEYATTNKLDHYSEIRLIDTENGKEIAFFKGHKGNVYTCALSRDQKILASGSLDKTLILWKVNKGLFDRSGEIATLSGHPEAVSACAFKPDGSLLVSGDLLGNLIFWDMANLNKHTLLKGHADRVTIIFFSQDGKYVTTGGFDKYLKVWNLEQRIEVACLPVEGRIFCGSMAEKEFLFVFGDEGGNLRVVRPINL